MLSFEKKLTYLLGEWEPQHKQKLNAKDRSLQGQALIFNLYYKPVLS